MGVSGFICRNIPNGSVTAVLETEDLNLTFHHTLSYDGIVFKAVIIILPLGDDNTLKIRIHRKIPPPN